MALIKYNIDSFIKGLEPGISALVVDSFKEKLEENINNIIQNTHNELMRELPEKISTIIYNSINPYDETRDIKVVVDLRDGSKE